MYSYMVSTMHACMQDITNYDRKIQLIRVVEMKAVQYILHQDSSIGSKQRSYNVYSLPRSLHACVYK